MISSNNNGTELVTDRKNKTNRTTSVIGIREQKMFWQDKQEEPGVYTITMYYNYDIETPMSSEREATMHI
jgi:hypothetical protein